MTDVPHFSLPFRFAPRAVVVEQDSLDEIADCVLAIVLYPLGYRVELPEFGIDDPTFSSPHVDVEALREAIDRWEQRAFADLSVQADVLDVFVEHVPILLRLRSAV